MRARSARLAVLFVLLSAATNADTSSPKDKPAKGSRPVGFIVPAERGREFYLQGSSPAEKFWTPTQSDVDRLESLLRDRLKTEKTRANRVPVWKQLDDYGRQYIGIVEKSGKRKIHTELFRLYDHLREQMTQGPILVKDGGDGFCRITYDVARATFGELSCNGEA